MPKKIKPKVPTMEKILSKETISTAVDMTVKEYGQAWHRKYFWRAFSAGAVSATVLFGIVVLCFA